MSAARYGAARDASADSTHAFQKAIEDCSAKGGGHVVVPAGVYSTGAIRLRSNVDLHLDAGAVVRFNGREDLYPLVLTRYAGIECVNRSPLVYAYGETNIALTGAGVLDGSQTGAWNRGGDFEHVLEPLVAEGLPPDQRIVPRHGSLRSSFVEPYACTNVLISGVRLTGSLFWQLHPTLCQSVTIDGVTTGGTTAFNSDGCDPESCDHVVIRNCTFDGADDSIAIKAGRDADGRRVNVPCQNIVIQNCAMQGPSGAIACGSEMTGGIRNVYVFNVRTYGSGTAFVLYVKSNTRRGGYAQNINLDHVEARNTAHAWAFAEMRYQGQTGTYPPLFSDWSIAGCHGDTAPYAFELVGLPADVIRDIRVSNSTFANIAHPEGGNQNVSNITFENVTVNGTSLTA